MAKNQSNTAENDMDADEVMSKRVKELELSSEESLADLRWVMSDPRGRRFMWKLLNNTGINRLSFTGNSHTFFNEGARNIGLQMTAILEQHLPGAYLEMLKEKLNKR
jgi:hypothetical protein